MTSHKHLFLLAFLTASAAAAQPTVSLSPVSVVEGTGIVGVTVTLSEVHDEDILVEVVGNGVSADDPDDFDGTVDDVTIPAGQLSGEVVFLIADDALDEDDETFNAEIVLAVDDNVVTIAADVDSAAVTIVDDDAPPVLSIASDGPNGLTEEFTISLSTVSAKDVSFTFRTVGITATDGADFDGGDTVLTIPAGDTEVSTGVDTLQDTLDEDDETYKVTLVNLVDATYDGNDVTITLADDDPTPTITTGDDITVAEDGTATVGIDLDAVSGRLVSFTLTVINSSAVAGEDFNGATISGSITAGLDHVDVVVPLIDDALDEDNETFSVRLATAVNATIPSSDINTNITITDNDAPPSCTVDNATVSEDNTTINVKVRLSGASGKTVRVDVDSNEGTAVEPEDFTDVDVNNRDITVGSLTTDIAVPIKEDAIDEVDETFTLVLSDLQNCSNGGAGTVTITDDDNPPTLSVNDANAVSEGGNSQFTVSLSGASSLAVTFDVAVTGGTATAVDDVGAPTTPVTINAGATSVVVVVPTVNDLLDENDGETFTLTLSNPVNASIADGSGTGTINDNDGLPSIAIGGATVVEGDSGTTAVSFPLTLTPVSGRAVSVTATTSAGSADVTRDFIALPATQITIPAGDTSGVVVVNVVNETTHDRVDLETFTVTIASAVNVTINTATATGTIDDNDPEPQVSIADATLGVEGANNQATGLNFVVSLDRLSELQTQVVATPSFGAGATASNADVFAQGAIAVVAALASTTNASVLILGDAIDEPDETFFVDLSSPTNGTIGDGNAVGTIIDDDNAPTLSIGNASVDEDAGDAVFNVTLSAKSGQPVSASFTTVNGTAGAGDFTATSGTLNIAADQLTTTVRVPIVNDPLDELDETFTVQLSLPVNATLLDGEGLGTIGDNDNAPNLAIADVGAVVEGDSGTVNASFRVSLSVPSGRTVTLPIKTTAVTADASDFAVNAGSVLTFNPGVTELIVDVAVTGDRLDEGTETFKLDAQAGVVGATVVDGSGTATITDDDDSPAAVADVYATDEEVDVSADVAAGVLANDSDGDVGDVVTAALAVDVDAASGVLTFNADGSFVFAPAFDFAGAATFSYTASDGVNSVTGNVVINVANINDAPVVDGGPGDVRVDEDVFDSAGALLKDVLDFVDDADVGDATGIAVVALEDVENGSFEVAFDGVTFEPIGLVSATGARLIAADDDTRVRLVPPPNQNPVVLLTFVAWDGSDGEQESSIVDTTARGLATSFSATEGQLRFSVLPINDGPELVAPTPDAPVQAIEGTELVVSFAALDDDSPTLTFTRENNTLPAAAVFDGVAKTLRWTPLFSDAGTYSFDVVVDDGDLIDRRTITVVAAFIDEDDDFVPDTVEAGIDLDTDSDDSDDDTILDLEELGPDILNPPDSDNDGTIDALDDDSDDDGVLDRDEAGDSQTATPRVDSDADDVVDALDRDSDDDGREDGDDNCRTVANADQANVDGDVIGDVCDDDRDGDGLLNRDEPELGLDADDPDSDDDTILDGVEAPGAVGVDTDEDDTIDALDDDSDGDGLDDDEEAGDDQLLTDPRDTDDDDIADYIDVDSDGDGVDDDVDNCGLTANADQVDQDGDGDGDACVQVCGDQRVQQGEACDDKDDIRCGADCQLIASEEVCDGIDNDLDGEIDVVFGDGNDGKRSVCDEDIEVTGGGVLGLLGCSAGGGGNALWLALVGLLWVRVRKAEQPSARHRRQPARAVPLRGKSSILLGFLGLLAAGSSQAQGLGTATFSPAPVGSEDFVVVEGTGAAGHLAPAGAVTFDYANGGLNVADGRTDASVALLEHRLTADVAASLSLFDRFVVSLGLPVALFQSAGVDDTFKPLTLASPAIGDLRLGGRWAILDPKVGPGAALSTTVSLPTGDPAQLMGNGGFAVHPRLIGGWRFGEHFRLTGNLGYVIRPPQQLFSFKVGNEVSYGVGAELPLPVDMPMWIEGDKGALSALIEVNGRVTGDPGVPFSQATSPLETQLAARYNIAAGHAVTAGAALGITAGYGTPLVRAFVAYSFTWPTFDKDKDGIDDENDGCPDRAEDVDGHDDDDGCPGDTESGEEIVDPDDDGILHPQDLCPEDAEDKDGFEDDDGCPDNDHDGDGVAEGADKCPTVPEDRDGHEDEDGCPDDDNDGDGFKDADDKCKNIAEVRNGFEDEDGCPDVPPAPVAPATTPAPVTDPAKPEPPPFMTEPGKIDLPQRIYFATAGADLTPEGKRLLEQVMQTMKDNPDIRVEIQGHTDGQGDNTANDKLALRRAQAVADYLVKNGINRPRLLIAILGMAEPLAPNDTLRGRALNRRVEFRVIER